MYGIFKRCLPALLLILNTYYLLLNTVPMVQALTMSDGNNVITTKGLNVASGFTENEDYKLRSATDDSNAEILEGVNFKIKKGFENLKSIPPFSISLSSGIIDFGILSPTNPIVRTVDLATQSSAVYGYSVLVSENKSLASTPPSSRVFIPDTTCDKGECGVYNASAWINALTYGFGYRCDNLAGVDCDNSFVKANSYKRFPNIANNDDPISIMAGIGSNDSKVRISYKVNISGNQTQDTYSNVITYIAVPNF